LPVYIEWDIEEYYKKHLKAGNDKKRVNFPNPSFGAFSEPLTVVDSKGRIVLWYLPGLLSPEQQVWHISVTYLETTNAFENSLMLARQLPA
jgi:hypothetical protein